MGQEYYVDTLIKFVISIFVDTLIKIVVAIIDPIFLLFYASGKLATFFELLITLIFHNNLVNLFILKKFQTSTP